jgi:nucleoside-diphosphate-sugar epimerase
VARKLVEQGHDVRALARDPYKTQHLAENGVELMRGDITKKETMRDAMTGMDGVFHIAEWYKLGLKTKPEIAMAEAVNVVGTRNVMELVRELKIPKCVYTSSINVFSDTKGRKFNETYQNHGPWQSIYDYTKWEAHYEVVKKMQEERVPIVIVQPGLIYGSGDQSGIHDMWVAYLQKRLKMVPKKTAFCWGHVEDIAEGHIQAMEKGKPGESYILAGPQHTLIEALEIAQKITGIKPPRFHPGPFTMQFFSAVMGVVGYLKPLPEASNAETLRMLAGKTYLGADQKARLELDFLPRSLEAGLREMLEFELAEQKRLTTDSGASRKPLREKREGATNPIALLKSTMKNRNPKAKPGDRNLKAKPEDQDLQARIKDRNLQAKIKSRKVR